MTTIRVFASKFEADTSKALLASNDIDAEVYGDPAYSVAPHLVTESGFDLMVLDPEIHRALDILGPVAPGVDELDAAYHHRRFIDRPLWIRLGTYALLVAIVIPIAWQGLRLLLGGLAGLFDL